MNHIRISNHDWPAHFGTSAIMKLEELTGQPFFKLLFSVVPKGNIPENADSFDSGLNVIQQTDVGSMVKILYAALWGGALKAKQPFNLTIDSLAEMLDDEGQNRYLILFEAVSIAFGSLPAAEENGQVSKKKK